MSLFYFSLNNSSLAADYPEGFPICYKDKGDGIKWQDDYCPLNPNTKLGHKLIIVDFTTKHPPFQRETIINSVFGKALIEDTNPYHKISFVRIDQNSASQQKPFFATCRIRLSKSR